MSNTKWEVGAAICDLRFAAWRGGERRLTPPTARLSIVAGLGRADTEPAATMIVVMIPDTCILSD